MSEGVRIEGVPSVSGRLSLRFERLRYCACMKKEKVGTPEQTRSQRDWDTACETILGSRHCEHTQSFQERHLVWTSKSTQRQTIWCEGCGTYDLCTPPIQSSSRQENSPRPRPQEIHRRAPARRSVTRGDFKTIETHWKTFGIRLRISHQTIH